MRLTSRDTVIHSPEKHPEEFASTRWSIVIDARRKTSAVSRRALAELCESYWPPLYWFIRRRGYGLVDARDLTQEFFAELLEKESLRVVDRQRGRFRSFLMTTVDHFLSNRKRKANAAKRGGNRRLQFLDFAKGETSYSLEPFHELTAEKIYERRWAMTLLDRVLARLRDESTSAGKQEQFESLKSYLGVGRQSVPYREIADRLEMTEGAVKVAIHRLRRRCHEVLRTEIAQTVADPSEIDDELRSLFAAVSGN